MLSIEMLTDRWREVFLHNRFPTRARGSAGVCLLLLEHTLRRIAFIKNNAQLANYPSYCF